MTARLVRLAAAVALTAGILYGCVVIDTGWFLLAAVIGVPVVWFLLAYLPGRAHSWRRIPFAGGRHRVTLRTPGSDPNRVRYVVVCALGVGVGDADRLISSVPAVLVADVSADTAAEFAARLEAAGAGVTVGVVPATY